MVQGASRQRSWNEWLWQACSHGPYALFVPHLEDFYDSLGRGVARNTLATIAVSTLVVIICAGGLPMLATELDYEASWIPQKSQAWSDRVALRDTFGSTAVSEIFMAHVPWLAAEIDATEARTLSAAMRATNSSGAAALEQLEESAAISRVSVRSTLLREAIASGKPEEAVSALGSGALSPPVLLLQLAVANAARSTAGYLQRCERAFDGGPCVELSVGAATGAAAGGSTAIGVAGVLDAFDVLDAVGAAGAGGASSAGSGSSTSGLRTPEGVPVPVDAVVGGVSRGREDGELLVGAEATQLLLLLQSPDTQAERDRVRDLEAAWIGRTESAIQCWGRLLRRADPAGVPTASLDVTSALPVRPDGSDTDPAVGEPQSDPGLCGGDGPESIAAEDAVLGLDAARGLRAFAAEWQPVAPLSYAALIDAVEVLPFSSRTYQDEQDRMVAADVPLVAAAVGLMIVYVALVLGDMPPVRSRVLLSMVCVIGCVGGSLAVSFGLGGYTGVPFNTMSQLAFFVLVAVGVDDGLLLSAVWDRITALEAEEAKSGRQNGQGKELKRDFTPDETGMAEKGATARRTESSRDLARSKSGVAAAPGDLGSFGAGAASGQAPEKSSSHPPSEPTVGVSDINPELNAESKGQAEKASSLQERRETEAEALTERLAVRLGRTLREAGPSVTLTSLTDALAFAIGTAIDIGAIRQFCITSAVAVAAVLLLQVTVFCAALVLDTRRRMAGRMDCCPCVPWEEGEGGEGGEGGDEIAGSDDVERQGGESSSGVQAVPSTVAVSTEVKAGPTDESKKGSVQAGGTPGGQERSQENVASPREPGYQANDGDQGPQIDLEAWEGERWLGACVRHHVAPVIRSQCQRRSIIALFLVLAVLAGWQASMVTKGLDEKDFLAEGSVPFRYLVLSAELFGAGADSMTIAAIAEEGSNGGQGAILSADDFLVAAQATDFAAPFEMALVGAMGEAADSLIPGAIPPVELPTLLALDAAVEPVGPIGFNSSVNASLDPLVAMRARADGMLGFLSEGRPAVSSPSTVINSTSLARVVYRFVTQERLDLQGDVRFRRWRGTDGVPMARLGPSAAASDVEADDVLVRGDYVLAAWRAVVTVRPPNDTPGRLQRMEAAREAVEVSQGVAAAAAVDFSDGSGGDIVVGSDQVEEAEEEALDSPSNSRGVVFMGEFLWLERYSAIDRITIQNLLLAGGAVLFSMLLFQPPRAAFLTTAVVALTCVDIIGGMTVLGLPINVATLVNLVMALGFACDYSAHVAQHFCVATGDRPKRAAESLAVTGAAVANGGFSTLLATFVLAFSQSGGFQTLFKMFALMVGFGLLHGMVLLPLLLAEVGPEEREDGAGAAGAGVGGGGTENTTGTEASDSAAVERGSGGESSGEASAGAPAPIKGEQSASQGGGQWKAETA